MDDKSRIQQPIQQKSPTELLAAQTQSLSELVEIQKIQKVQIAELQKQNEQMIMLLAERQSVTSVPGETYVTIEDIDMSFRSLVGFILKVTFASIPTAIILAAIYFVIVVALGGILGSI
jgi:hypothetical protein